MNFYDRVKELAESQNKPLIKLLEENGIKYDSYKTARRQGYLLRTDESCKIAKALNTTVEYLVYGN